MTNKPEKRVIFDLDSVLLDVYGTFENNTGMNITEENFVNYSEKMFGLVGELLEEGKYEEIPTKNGAIGVIEKIKNNGYEIFIVTSRRELEVFGWLEYHGLDQLYKWCDLGG